MAETTPTGEFFQVAIDGPAASGKSTAARLLASRIGGYYINTGDMYRTVSWKALALGISPDDDPDAVVRMLADLDLHYRIVEGRPLLFLNGTPVRQAEIRSPQVAAIVSQVARIPGVRSWLLELQRECKSLGRIVMEGRDIATVIFPNAKFKFFITASPLERARRRLAQTDEVTDGATLESVAADIARRDEIDSTREVAPLKPAPDSIIVQTDGLDANEVADRLAEIVLSGHP